MTGQDLQRGLGNSSKSTILLLGEDFVEVISKSGNNSKGGRQAIDYHFFTLDTAKGLAMVESNDKGRQARKYFIECERKVLEVASGTKQPQLENQLPAIVEKACDFASWRLANENQQHTMTLAGSAAHPGDEELSRKIAFLIKKRLYARPAVIAKDLLRKNTQAEAVSGLILRWSPTKNAGSRNLPDVG
jgi:phage anti-repressor protein